MILTARKSGSASFSVTNFSPPGPGEPKQPPKHTQNGPQEGGRGKWVTSNFLGSFPPGTRSRISGPRSCIALIIVQLFPWTLSWRGNRSHSAPKPELD